METDLNLLFWDGIEKIETDRQTATHTHTDRQIDGHTQTDRQTDCHTHTHR